ncbi:RNA polymerase sigma factor [Lunatibacter salilacus]|uniref:RNA polymerase sigma factor n=1 Tax=Lunatibacter salilacus TaxID=2483804 RepID=UPI00131DDA56|nr:sigma-70 family RNA polymerase sigma factor [Lunatibacter salilacus]
MTVDKDYDDEKAIRDIGLNVDLQKPIRYLYACHYNGVERYILRNSGSTFDAEDIFQETLMVTIKAIQGSRFRADSSLKSYVFAIAKNLWISELRRRKSASKRAEIYTDEQDMQIKPTTNELIRNEDFKLVLGLFESLGGKCKRILLLFYYQDMSMKEIMEAENYTSEQVVRNKKYKCLKTLIDQIKSDPILYENVKDALNYE